MIRHGPLDVMRSPGALRGATGAEKKPFGERRDQKDIRGEAGKQGPGCRHIGEIMASVLDGVARRAIIFNLANCDFDQANRIRIASGLAWDDLLGRKRAA